MNKPEVYFKSRACSTQTDYSRHIMEDYFPFIRQNSNNVKSVLDIGCGPGNTTLNVILPYLEQDTVEIIGIDKSPSMIDYAKKTYEDARVAFKEVNVVEVAPRDFIERFDYIFSFWTFHWILDQRKLYSNVLKMLKPNGSFLVSYIANTKLYGIIQEVSQKEKYSSFVSNLSIFPFNMFINPQQELFSILQDAEFENIFCKVETLQFTDYTTKDLENLFLSVSPYYDCIPINMQKEFIQDHIDLVDTVNNPNYERKYLVDYDMVIAHCRKKGN
ncbi:hypothetical protein RI129_001507 [Pyrocoelia pectoralis]|uniref:Methyltransferase domain-containing protein n=1 Tax=Pyrocoelia pectoralis TaxID=417401 RepID=A0AAN7VVP0_9COLE